MLGIGISLTKYRVKKGRERLKDILSEEDSYEG